MADRKNRVAFVIVLPWTPPWWVEMVREQARFASYGMEELRQDARDEAKVESERWAALADYLEGRGT